jgi:hypothetical protein
MKRKAFEWTSRSIVVLVVLAANIGALAANPQPKTLSGVINAYTPQPSTGAGPYEVRGPWSLKWNRESGKADFYAALNMEFSDGLDDRQDEFRSDSQGGSYSPHHSS